MWTQKTSLQTPCAESLDLSNEVKWFEGFAVKSLAFWLSYLVCLCGKTLHFIHRYWDRYYIGRNTGNSSGLYPFPKSTCFLPMGLNSWIHKVSISKEIKGMRSQVINNSHHLHKTNRGIVKRYRDAVHPSLVDILDSGCSCTCSRGW